MKALKLFIVALFVLTSTSIYAQSHSKVIAIVNKADWCSICQANGERVMTQVLTAYKEVQITVAANDLTNAETKAQSKIALVKLGVYNLVSNENKTGQIILIDRKSNKVISKISVAKSNAELKQALNSAIKKS